MHKTDAFQDEAVAAGVAAVIAGKDFLLVSPTGSGKTGMASRIGKGLHEETGARVLVLTHRKNLAQQMAGDPKADTHAGRLGEIGSWIGEPVGRYNDSVVNEEPWLVVGMVQTLQNRIASGTTLRRYDAIVIDEAHHAYGPGADAGAASAYAAVIAHVCAANPKARVIGLTATDFRADPEETLDPRLEAAERHVVTFERALAAGRIVEPRTVRPALLHRNRKTVEEMADELVAAGGRKRVEAEIGPMLASQRRDDFWDQAVSSWLKEAPGKKTIAFTDTVEEMKLLADAFARAAKDPATARTIGAVEMIGSHRSDEENQAASARYASGDTRILISCKMIGEGYNVPDTDAVLMTNRCTTRSWYQQMKGRAMRARPGKEAAICIDLGATSYVFGTLEQQIELQAVEHALATAADEMSQAAAIARIWYNAADSDPSLQGWMVLPSEKTTRFLRRTPQGELKVYSIEHGTARANQKNGAMSRLQAMKSPQGRTTWTIGELAALTAEDLDTDRGWHAIMRSRATKESNAWEARAAEEIRRQREPLQMIVRHEAPARAKIVAPVADTADEKAAKRDARVGNGVRAGLAGDAKAMAETIGFVESLLEKNQTRAGAREVLALAAVALREVGRSREWPKALSQAAQAGASAILDNHGRGGLKALTPGKVGDLLAGAGRVLEMVADQSARAGRADIAESLRRLAKTTARAGELMAPREVEAHARVA